MHPGASTADSVSAESDLRWSLLFEQSPLSIQVFAPDGLTIRFNPAWKNLFGLTDEEAYAFNVLQAPDLIESGAIHHIRKAFEGEIVFVPPVPFPVRGKPREIRWIGGTLYPVITPDGILREVVVIHHDITELKEAEETMRRLNDILEERVATRTAELAASEENLRVALDAERQLNRLKTAFVGMVSHEFRTPLGVINTATEILDRYHDRLTPDQRAEHTHSILGAVRRMTGMMEHILLLARIDSGNVTLHSVRLDLPAWLERSITELSQACPFQHPVEIAINGRPALRKATLDESLLHHIVSNLFSNACKYSPPGTPIRISLSAAAREMHLAILNEGKPITASDQEHLFEGFFRGSNVGNLPGTGLGLAITQRCVELLGGTIGLDSRHGHGTTFTVTLPLTPAMP